MGKDTFFSSFTLRVGKKLLSYTRPCVVGILNADSDSFYDGGRYVDDEAVAARAVQIVAEGADMVDVGVVSSRPGAVMMKPDDEALRLAHMVRVVRSAVPQAVVSVDTCFAKPAVAAVEAGADIVNDISGGQFDDRMWPTVAELGVPYVFMHTRGLPSVMDAMASYDDLVEELAQYFSRGLDRLYSLGVCDVILDPGFGFAKTVGQSLYLLEHLDELTALLRQPMMVGLSRKRMIYEPLCLTPAEVLEPTIEANMRALCRGARLLRVHDVKEHVAMVEKLQR